MNKHRPCTTCSKIHYLGVWFLMKIIVHHVEGHMKLRGRAGHASELDRHGLTVLVKNGRLGNTAIIILGIIGLFP